MQEFEKYIFVGALHAVSQQSSGRSAFSASELRDGLKSWFGVEFSEDEVRSAFLGALNGLRDRDLIDHVWSPFATERFSLNVADTRRVARAADVVEVWDNWKRVGDEWLQEALTNIREGIDSGMLVSEHPAGQQKLEYKSIPASDRYVSNQDNQQTFQAISSELISVRKLVENSNSIEDEERLISLSEIALFETAVCQPRLASDIIERFLKFCSTKLSIWIGAAAVELLVEKLRALIDDFVSAIATAG